LNHAFEERILKVDLLLEIGYLKLHYLRAHSGEKPMACLWPGCEYKTTTTNGLNKHIQTHTKGII